MAQASVKRSKGVTILFILFVLCYLILVALDYTQINDRILHSENLSATRRYVSPVAPLGPFADGSEIRQEIRVQGELVEVSVMLATYARTNSGTVTISLWDGETELASETLPQAQIADNAFFTLALPKPQDFKESTLITLQIDTEGSGETDSITAWVSADKNLYRQGDLYYNGLLCDSDLCFSYRLARNEVMGGLSHWIWVISILAIFTLAYWLFFGKLLFSYFQRLFLSLKAKPLIWLARTGIVTAAICIGLASEYVYNRFLIGTNNSLGTQINPPRAIFFISILILAAVFFFLRKQIRSKPEKLFLAIVLILGLMFIVITPVANHISWDDETHYYWSLSQSFTDDVYMTEADIQLWQDNPQLSLNLSDVQARTSELDELYRAGYTDTVPNVGMDRFILRIGHWPAGLAMAFARSLGLPFQWIFLFGKIGILLAYTTIVYFAIRKLRSGKLLMSAIACMPTPMLLATNYSYDYWIIAWLMLGTATYFSEMQKPDKKISGKSILIILFSMLMACLPKQTYVPMLLPLLFIKRSKFSTKRLHRIYILSVIILGIVILATLFLMRMNSLMTGDNRGGEEVSGVGQIHYILTNPLGFIQTLLLFIKDYISYASMGHTLTFLAYLGTTSATSYAACFLVILAITDKAEGGLDFCTWSTRLLTWTGGLITIILIATTLYISFTPVGLNTVNGCQPRYLLPLIFPATYLIGSCKFENKMNRTLYYYMGYGMTAFILLTAIWERLAGHYL